MSDQLRELYTQQYRAKLREISAVEEQLKALRQEAAAIAKMATVDSKT